MSQLASDGFHVVPCLDERQARQLASALEPLAPSNLRERRGGVRNLLERSPAVRALAQSAPLRNLVEPILGPDARAVRGILFDKTPEANWKVIWHQDLTIAVRAQHELEGFGPWSLKDGVTCVQPPLAILENMIAVRVHLDECGPTNGPLRVIAGSHRHGRLGADDIERLRRELHETVVTARVGEANPDAAALAARVVASGVAGTPARGAPRVLRERAAFAARVARAGLKRSLAPRRVFPGSHFRIVNFQMSTPTRISSPTDAEPRAAVTLDDAAHCTRVLEALIAEPLLLQALPEPTRIALLRAAGRLRPRHVPRSNV